MTWVKLDDGFYRNRKARLAGKDGRALFLAGLCHCSSALTDGHVGTYDLPVIAAEAEVKPAVARRLVDVGLWMEVDDGWLVHDYQQYNRSAADVRSEREEGRKRAAESARRRSGASGEASREEKAKPNGSFARASPDPSSSSSRLSGVTSVESSSSSTLSSDDDDDWPVIIAKRRLAHREADLGNVGNRKKWLVKTIDDVIIDHAETATAFLEEHPEATRQAIADHLEPETESATSQLGRLAAEMRQ